MSFIRQLIEKKISSVTGAAVMFGDFKFSPMSGTIELMQAKVAAERFVPPFLSVDRIEIKVAVAKALKGEIVIRSLLIERPTLICNIHADGKTNLPAKPKKKVEEVAPKEGTAGGTWEFNADKVVITGGRAEFRDATHNNYKVSAEGINATITPLGQDIAVSLKADSVGRRDQLVELGIVDVTGTLSGGGFKDPLASSMDARASIGKSVAFHITSTLLANRSFDIEMAGSMKMMTLMGLLPLPPGPAWVMEGDGNVALSGKLTMELSKQIRVSNVNLKAGDFNLNRTFGKLPEAPKQPRPA
jgi:uncharacterized protein involved in outer membrane biogenesis